MIFGFLVKNKRNILYGISLALLLFLVKWLELRLIVFNHATEVYVGAIALIFTLLGIWLASKFTSGKKVEIQVVEKETIRVENDSFILNEDELNRFCISKRELEVLQLMSEGLSNREIAERLFVSVNTIKTHSSNLFEKMEVERRTQAIDKAKKLGLIP